jgi:hypothetical protein
MLSKKTLIFLLTSIILLFSFMHPCQAATKASQNALTLEISSPDPMPGQQPNERPNPIFLQITMNDGTAPVYSAPVFPGVSKPIILKMVAASSNGAQIQFVTSTGNNIQPLSFIYSFAGDRLNCMINKNATIQVVYSMTTKLLNVQGIPNGC